MNLYDRSTDTTLSIHRVAELVSSRSIEQVLETLCNVAIECGSRWCVATLNTDEGERIVACRGIGHSDAEQLVSGDEASNAVSYRLSGANATIVVPESNTLVTASFAIAERAIAAIAAEQRCRSLEHALVERDQLLETMFEIARDATLATSRERLLYRAGLRLMAHAMTSRVILIAADGNRRCVIWSRGVHLSQDDAQHLIEHLDHSIRTSELARATLRQTLLHQRIADLVPMVVRGRTIGAIGIGQSLSGDQRRYDEAFVTAYANALALSLDQLTLVEQLVERESLERELALARHIQRRLLPPESLDVAGDIEIAVHVEAARHVSGDYCDVVVRDGNVLTVVADVCGKGIGAALIMAHLHAAFHLLARKAATPSQILSELNRMLVEHTDSGSFVTAVVAEYDPALAQIRYANAGHPMPLLLLPDGSVQRLDVGSIVLGVLDDADYTESALSLPPGAALCLYSDGVIEAVGTDGNEFGEERMIGVLAGAADKNAQEIAKALAVSLSCHRGTAALSDDCTFLIMRRLP